MLGVFNGNFVFFYTVSVYVKHRDYLLVLYSELRIAPRREGHGSVVRETDSRSKGLGFETRQERRDNCVNFFGIRSTPVLLQ